MARARLRSRAALAALTIIVTSVPTTSAAPPNAAPARSAAKPSADRVVFFASDGMRPDLMERYADEGVMPTYRDLMRQGVRGDNGLVQAFPPNTGVGWYTLATGTYPSETGSTNNTFFRGGSSNFNDRTSAFSAGVLQADTIANAAERAGKTVTPCTGMGL